MKTRILVIWLSCLSQFLPGISSGAQNFKGNGVIIEGQTFNRRKIELGIPLKFNPSETKTILIKEI